MQRAVIMMGLTVMLAAVFVLPVRANYVQVDNVVLRNQDTDEHTVEVQFDLSWENSWRNELNHDAAWVFVKFRAPGSNPWQHAYLSTNAADHTVVGPVTPHGYQIAVGVSSNEVNPALGVGVFVRAANAYTGTVSYTQTRLLWDYGESGYAWATGEELDVSVYAIEMVYVEEGSFFVGSGGTESGSFTEGSWDSGATLPLAITSEAAIEIGPAPGKLWGTSPGSNNDIGPEGTLPAAFPKGHAAFYSMKYSITQGQYVEFLNLLTYAQQNSRINASPGSAPGTYAHDVDRHAIHVAISGVASDTPAVYATDYPYVACNYLSWMDGAAYAQWAGLRPMTELEYEKACRGPAAPVANEWAWGANTISGTGGSANYSNLGEHNESVSQGNATFSGNNPGGPVRVGIFATNNATRITSGATYWGIMEMSGNVYERPVSVGRPDDGRTFKGTHGDGVLSSAGHATLSDWPGYNSLTKVVTGAGGDGYRGGDWRGASSLARASDRSHAAVEDTLRRLAYGWRGVRSASSGVGN